MIDTILFWIVCFISLYFIIFWLLVFLEEGTHDSSKSVLNYYPFVSVIIPAYNEEKGIRETIKSAINLNYPKDRLEIIAVNHGSTDNTLNIMKEFKDKIKIITIKRVPGEKKGAAVNKGLKVAKGEFFACLDSDSTIEKGALHKMLPYFKDKDVGAVLPRIKTIKNNTIMSKIQWMEYLVTFVYKKLMSRIDCVHVTPGPFSLYRKNYVNKVGNFDKTNLTEDMELALKLQKNDYKIIQTMDTEAFTSTPATVKDFYKQRNRWYKGSLLNIIKHRDLLFNRRYGEFGMMQMPMILISSLIMILLFATTYYSQLIKPIIQKISLLININYNPLILIKPFLRNFTILDINYNTAIIIWILFALGLVFILCSFKVTEESLFRKGIKTPLSYLVFYYPLIFIIWVGVLFDLLINRIQKW